MKQQNNMVGTTHTFVLSQGFTRIGNHDALIGADGTKRLFAELFADPDRPDVHPKEAYQAILSSIQPGWTLRLLQTFWPDSEPRLVFQRQVQRWQKPASEGLNILYQGLLLSTEQFPLPFGRRTIMEFVYPGEEGLAWWDSILALGCSYGINISYLIKSNIETVVKWTFTPHLESDVE
jgi:hypothetical protein